MADQEDLAQVISEMQHRNCLHEPEPPSAWSEELAQMILDSDFMEKFEITAKVEVLRGQAHEVRQNWDDLVAWDIATMLEKHADRFEAEITPEDDNA